MEDYGNFSMIHDAHDGIPQKDVFGNWTGNGSMDRQARTIASTCLPSTVTARNGE